MENLQAKLERATAGLMMMSESDYPFEFFRANAPILDESVVLSLSGKPKESTISVIEVDYLFRNMIKVYPEFTQEQIAIAERFKSLIKVLKTELTQLRVYRVGDVQVDVFIAGISTDGYVAGLKTRLIET